MLDVADVPDTVLAAWSLAAEAADELAPAGLAWPTLALAAVLGAHGIPGAVLTCPAACGYVTGLPGMSGQGAVRAALSNLARVGLVSIDLASPVRTVRMHPSVRAAVLAYLTQADLEQVIRAAADALIQIWPESDAMAAARDRRQYRPRWIRPSWIRPRWSGPDGRGAAGLRRPPCRRPRARCGSRRLIRCCSAWAGAWKTAA